MFDLILETTIRYGKKYYYISNIETRIDQIGFGIPMLMRFEQNTFSSADKYFEDISNAGMC